MKTTPVIILVLVAMLTACGPNKSQLKSELSAIDHELMELRIAAEQHRAQMSQAEFDAFIGSFAVGYGATTDDYGLAGEGVGTVVNSSRQYDASRYSLDQLKQRYEILGKRRQEIVRQLK